MLSTRHGGASVTLAAGGPSPMGSFGRWLRAISGGGPDGAAQPARGDAPDAGHEGRRRSEDLVRRRRAPARPEPDSGARAGAGDAAGYRRHSSALGREVQGGDEGDTAAPAELARGVSAALAAPQAGKDGPGESGPGSSAPRDLARGTGPLGPHLGTDLSGSAGCDLGQPAPGRLGGGGPARGPSWQLTYENSTAASRGLEEARLWGLRADKQSGAEAAVQEAWTRMLVVGHDDSGRKTMNQYVKERTLGRGSYCKVVQYRNLETGTPVAIKTCSKSRMRRIRVHGTDTALTDVYREIEILSTCQHPNVIQLLEVIDPADADKLYMVLEFAEQGSVFHGTGPPGGMGEARARECIRGAAQALQFLHGRGIVHGDVKPDNILVMADSSVRLCDFSVSTILKVRQDLEGGEEMIRRSPGTPVFSAPECCTGVPFSGKKADIWALGCTLFICTTGRYPFLGRTIEETFQKILTANLALPPALSDSLQVLLTRLLEKDPNCRASLEEVLHHPWINNGLTVTY